MVEERSFPTGRRVAVLALHREHEGLVIGVGRGVEFGKVARRAVARSSREHPARMTLGAIERDVHPREREGRVHEARSGPARRDVAAIAARGPAHRLVIRIQGTGQIRAVAGHALGVGAREVPDLRAGFAYVLAALIAHEPSTLTGLRYLDRGYENLETKLQSLGANIERIVIPETEEALVSV